MASKYNYGKVEVFCMGKSLAEQEKAILRNAQEGISSEIRHMIDIRHRLEDIREYDCGVSLVKESLWHCQKYLNNARLSIDDALTHNRDHFE